MSDKLTKKQGELMDKLEILENEIEDLKKTLSSFSENTGENNNSSNSGDNGQNSSSTSEKPWTTVFDYSDDEKNFSYPQGIFGSIEEIEDFPDLASYKELKFTYYGQSMTSVNYYIFDISNPENHYMHLFQTNNGFTYMYNFTVSIQTKTDTGKRTLFFKNSIRIGFASNKYPTIVNQKTTTQSRILKIEAR